MSNVLAQGIGKVCGNVDAVIFAYRMDRHFSHFITSIVLSVDNARH